MPNVAEKLAALTKQVEAALNPPTAVAMTADEFTAYAQEQVTKAQGESGDAQKGRLQALKDLLATVPADFEKGSEKVDVVKFESAAVSAAPVAPVSAAPAPAPVAAEPAAPVAKSVDNYWPPDLASPEFRKAVPAKSVEPVPSTEPFASPFLGVKFGQV